MADFFDNVPKLSTPDAAQLNTQKELMGPGGLAVLTADPEPPIEAVPYILYNSATPTPLLRIQIGGTTYDLSGSPPDPLVWTNLTLGSLWQATTAQPPQYSKSGGGVVRLRGAIHRTMLTLSAMATLPEGFRPPADVEFPTTWGANANEDSVKVQADGNIIPVTSTDDHNLNAISFVIAGGTG